jgi:hypothetical protein
MLSSNEIHKQAIAEVGPMPSPNITWVAYKDKGFKEFNSKQQALEYSQLVEKVPEDNESCMKRVGGWNEKVYATYSTLLRNKYPFISVTAINDVISDLDYARHLVWLDLIERECELVLNLKRKPKQPKLSNLKEWELVVVWNDADIETDNHPYRIGRFKGIFNGHFAVYWMDTSNKADYYIWDNCVRLSDFRF